MSAVMAGLALSTVHMALMTAMLAGCSKEARTLAADLPQTPPHDAADPRIAKYQGNAYQVSQGGRMFTWYGCAACHAAGARGGLDLGDGRWRHGGGFDRVYGFIAHGHGAATPPYGDKIPVEQLWQITAYVRNLSNVPPEQRQRQDHDQQGEPQGATWSGAAR